MLWGSLAGASAAPKRFPVALGGLKQLITLRANRSQQQAQHRSAWALRGFFAAKNAPRKCPASYPNAILGTGRNRRPNTPGITEHHESSTGWLRHPRFLSTTKPGCKASARICGSRAELTRKHASAHFRAVSRLITSGATFFGASKALWYPCAR